MEDLTGRVAIVTGAGRGLGRAEALLLASRGAKVVVNDLGVDLNGGEPSSAAANEVVEQIRDSGGEAIANANDVADFAGAQALIGAAIETFGGLDVLVNSVGILRDRMSFNMGESDWNDVVRVHLTGTFAPSRFAGEYFRACAKAGEPRDARIVTTTSEAGLIANTGHVNYMASKAAIAALTISLSRELGGYGVTVNSLSPRAKTRMTASGMGTDGADDPNEEFSPHNVAPFVGYLAGPGGRDVTGQVFVVSGDRIELWHGWHPVEAIRNDGRWTVESMGDAIRSLTDAHGARPAPLPEDEHANAGRSK